MKNSSEKAFVEAPVIMGAFGAMNSQAITVCQERCAKVRNRNVACLKCAQACTSGCISLQDDQLVIDASKCVGCGTCATVCPTCALEANHPNDEQLFSACKAVMDEGSVVIACDLALEAAAELIDQTRVASVVCAGRIDESLMLRLAGAGATQVQVVCGHCDKCAQRLGREVCEMAVRSTNDLLKAWESDAQVSVFSAFPPAVLHDGATEEACESALNRFFSSEQSHEPLEVVCEGEKEVSHDFQMPHVMKDGTLPHFLPDRRERLLDALSELGNPVSEKIRSRLWGWVVIDGLKCVSCRMCATFCPTGAIRKFDEEDGTFGVRHFPGDCVKCLSCRDICPANAIIVMDDVPTKYLMDDQTHRYVMKERPTVLNNAQQILSHMRYQMAGSDIFER